MNPIQKENIKKAIEDLKIEKEKIIKTLENFNEEKLILQIRAQKKIYQDKKDSINAQILSLKEGLEIIN